MGTKYKIVKLCDNNSVDFYGADIGDIIELSNVFETDVWAIGSEVFKEEGWTGLANYYISGSMNSFLKYVEEVV